MPELELRTENCKSCGFCVSVCPKKVLELGEEVNKKGYHYAVVKRPEDCIACLQCAIMCPDAIIEVYK